MKSPTVFIVSSGRSGTTLLTSILNSSGEIYIPYESDFVARAYPFFRKKQNFTVHDYEKIAKIFRFSSQQYGWGMSRDYIVSQLKKRRPKSFAEVNSTMYEAFHRLHNTVHLKWGIKRPVLIANLERVNDTFPSAKIIHVVRDGRDVCLSYKKVHQNSEIKFGPKGIVANALFWVDGIRRVEKFKERHPSCQLYELRYVDLLTKPELTLRSLCDFLGISYDPSMHQDFNKSMPDKRVAPDKLMKGIHGKLSSGLDSKNIQKYKSAMSTTEKMTFEVLAAPYLRKYNYELELPSPILTIFKPVRCFLYSCARKFNDWRYKKRDQKLLNQAENTD